MKPDNYIVKWVVNRIKKNKNCIILINGPTGSGKTYAGLDFAVALSKALGTMFELDNNMDFDFKELLRKSKLPQNLKPGVVYLFEEVGAVGSGSAAREWQSKVNKFFNSFMQTARHKNQIFIMTCPIFGELEKGTRQLVHMQITMEQVDEASETSVGKVFVTQTNVITGKIYMKYIRCNIKGNRTKIKRVQFNLPNQEMLFLYEKKKKQFTDKLDKTILDDGKPKTATGFVANPRSITPAVVSALRSIGWKNQRIMFETGLKEDCLKYKIRKSGILRLKNDNLSKENPVFEGLKAQNEAL
jgi:hypothetical protein